jgi:hypothetical protein
MPEIHRNRNSGRTQRLCIYLKPPARRQATAMQVDECEKCFELRFSIFTAHKNECDFGDVSSDRLSPLRDCAGSLGTRSTA